MSWIKERSASESLKILRALSEKCAELGGPVSRRLNQIAQDDYASLMSYEIDYSEFSTSNNNGSGVLDAIYARQILALFQKSQFLKISDTWDRTEVAAKRFVEAEAMCLKTNRRIKEAAADPKKVDPAVSVVLFHAQRKIAAILKYPAWDEFPFAFGPGANTNVKSSHANPRIKLGAALECSTDLTPMVGALLEEVPHWTDLHDVYLGNYPDRCRVNVHIVPGKVIFVPKNAKTDRSISVEPILNSFFQKGVGSYIRDQLKMTGVDLRDQTANQKKACLGSIDGTLSTLDLSMASDCLSRELVWSLLPVEWAEFLDYLRTSRVTMPDVISDEMLVNAGLRARNEETGEYTLQKFSSMGNGYTFELESLVFYALCWGVCKYLREDLTKIGVYGDDLIVPTGASSLLIDVLSYCGFSINKEKSFVEGPFRESCGADYLGGFDIRPYYQKTQISERHLFTMHNWFIRNGECELAAVVDQFLHPAYRIYGPDGFGDGHLIGSHSLRYPRIARRAGWCGGYFDTYILRARRYTRPTPGDIVLPVYSVYTRSGADSPTDPDIIRGSKGYAKVSIYTLGSSIFSRSR